MTKYTFVDLLQFIEQKAWIAENFPRDRRFENLILASENILTADTVKYVRRTNNELIYNYSFIVCKNR